MERVVLTPLHPGDEVAGHFLAFEKRVPRIGVHLGLRRDCGSTLTTGWPAANGGLRQAFALHLPHQFQ